LLIIINNKLSIHKKGEKQMKEKISIITGIGIVVLVIAIAILFLTKSSFTISDILLVIIPLILVIGAIIVLWDRIKNLKMGLPSADERAKKLQWKAGAYAYFATIWIAIGSMWYNIIFADELGFPALNAGQIVAVIVLLSALCWFSFQLYFMRKGDIE